MSNNEILFSSSGSADIQVEMIATFLKTLKDLLTNGELYSAVLNVIMKLMTGEFLVMILNMAAQCLNGVLEIAGKTLDLDLPEIPTLGPLPIPQVVSGKITLDADACASMGALDIGTAMSQFIKIMIDCVESLCGLTAIKDLLEKIIKEYLFEQIKQLAETAIQLVEVAGLSIGELILPPIISVILPSYPDPIIGLGAPRPLMAAAGGNMEITAEVDVDLQSFQSQLFAPKLLQCLEEVIIIAKDAFEQVKEDLVEPCVDLFTDLIEDAKP